MNHLFQKCKTTDTAEFFQIQGCMDADALKVIIDWIIQRPPRM